ncbi:MAG: hypothetical protein JO095_18915 [Alphaproteobacteria bacterium]|nr:hypothetical protein [Alphaproteobacteria bacterium]
MVSDPDRGRVVEAAPSARESAPRQRRQLCELFEHEPLLPEAWGLKEALLSVYRSSNRD